MVVQKMKNGKDKLEEKGRDYEGKRWKLQKSLKL